MSPKKILIIEGDRETAAQIAEELADRGFAVCVAQDGHEGLAAILRERPGLVICEVLMPHILGFDVLTRLIAMAPRIGKIPFVFLTDLADREDELKARRLGADDYITKPIDFDILGAIIDARLVGTARSPAWPKLVTLNDREVETLTWAARGKTSVEIAAILDLAKRTVDFHIDNARDKLGVTTRIQAAVKAVAGGLIEP